MKKSLGFILLIAFGNAFAADLNGYTAQYEKPIGTPPPCSATISSVNDPDWAKLNDSSYRVICFEPGDYTSKGMITLTANGSSGNERWLRYYRSNDTDDDPWIQSSANQAIIRGIRFVDASYWVIHRITSDGNYSQIRQIEVASDSNNVIFNRILAEKGGGGQEGIITVDEFNNSDITVQNSVIRDQVNAAGADNDCIVFAGVTDLHIVNNEIYGCGAGVFQWEGPASPGLIVENNDIYTDPNEYTDCNGNYTQNGAEQCAAVETNIELKNGGTAAAPMRIFQNRIWGVRSSDTNVCCDGGGGQGSNIQLIETTVGTSYILVRNNTVFDGQQGLVFVNAINNPSRQSIVGNIFWNHKQFYSGFSSPVFSISGANNSEIYLNTVIDAVEWYEAGGPGNDVQCNVIINGGSISGGAGSGTQVDHNVFYNTPKYTTENPGTNIVYTNVADAKNEPYCFYRKLRTGPEQVCIPNARPTSSSPHRSQCPSNLGSRSGVGINDDLIY